MNSDVCLSLDTKNYFGNYHYNSKNNKEKITVSLKNINDFVCNDLLKDNTDYQEDGLFLVFFYALTHEFLHKTINDCKSDKRLSTEQLEFMVNELLR